MKMSVLVFCVATTQLSSRNNLTFIDPETQYNVSTHKLEFHYQNKIYCTHFNLKFTDPPKCLLLGEVSNYLCNFITLLFFNFNFKSIIQSNDYCQEKMVNQTTEKFNGFQVHSLIYN